MNVLRPEVVGGEHLLGFRDYLPLIPWVYLFSFASRGLPLSGRDIWLWLAADTVAITVMALWFVVGARTIFRDRRTRPAPLWAVMAFGAVLGGLKGAVTGVAAVGFGLEPEWLDAISERLIQTALVGAWIVPATSIFAHTLQQLSSERDAILRLRINKQLQKPWELAPLLAARTAPLVDTLVSSQTTQPHGVTAETVRDLVDQHIRPLSKALWSKVGKEIPPYRLWQLYGVYFSGATGVPWLALGLWSATTWPALAVTEGVTEANLAVAAVTLGATLSFSLTRLVPVLSPLVGVSLVTVSLAATGLLAAGMSFVLEGQSATLTSPIALVSTLVWFALLIANVGALGILQLSRQQVRVELDSLETGPFGGGETESVVIDAKLARLIHNDIQNRLLALADQAESRDERLSATDILAVLEQVGHGTRHDTNDSHLADRLNDLVRRWEGVVDVHVGSVPRALTPFDHPWDDTVVDVVTEGLTNAVRHGLATAVDVSIHTLGAEDGVPRIAVTVVDNGVGPRAGSPGLGTHLLDTVSPGSWSLEPGETGGSRLTVTLSAEVLP